MVCPTCNLDNDPAVQVCARCNTTLQPAPPPPTTYRPTPAPPHTPTGPSRLPLVAALAVLLALVTAAVLIYRANSAPTAAPRTPLPPTTVDAATTEPLFQPPPTEQPETEQPQSDPDQALRTQAAGIDALLDRSFASRTKLNNAIQDIGNCTNLSQAVADMRTVGDERRAQLTELSTTDLAALPNGESLRSLLTTALQHSLDADTAYIAWAAPTITGGCAQTPARRTARTRGQAESTKAGAAKEAFLTEWTPVAAELNLQTRTRQSI